jgi:hypothetical protein
MGTNDDYVFSEADTKTHERDDIYQSLGHGTLMMNDLPTHDWIQNQFDNHTNQSQTLQTL